MRRHCLFPIVTGLLFASPLFAQDRCGGARDLMVRALEQIGPGASRDALADARGFLKRATEMCPELGDAWYYRSLVEGRSGNKGNADKELERASMFGSEALREKIDPFVLAVPTAPKALPPIRRRFALLVGIGQFGPLAEVDGLKGTLNDVRLMQETLSEPPLVPFAATDIRVLQNERATTKEIKSELNRIAREAQPEDLVVIYVATHGFARSDDSVAGQTYLVTYDTDTHGEDNLYGSAFPMVELINAVASRIRALRVAVILDTCHSGGASDAHKKDAVAISSRTVSRFKNGSGRIILTATTDEQLSNPFKDNGVFTYYLAKELRESKGKRKLSEVFTDLRRDVEKNVQENSDGQLHQTPTMSRSDESTDFSLGPDTF